MTVTTTPAPNNCSPLDAIASTACGPAASPTAVMNTFNPSVSMSQTEEVGMRPKRGFME